MRKCLTIMVLLFWSCSLQAQTWDEWFKQRKTQRRYLVNQIVALQVYLGYLQKGYEIASEGLTAVNDIKNGDFNLHNGFFNSLDVVKPSISNSTLVADIISMQKQVVRQGRGMIDMVNECGQFTGAEILHFKKVIDRLLAGCFGILSELMLVITSGSLEMKDDERIQRIEKMRKEMEENYRFCGSYSDDLRRLAMQRLVEGLEVERSRKLYGLH